MIHDIGVRWDSGEITQQKYVDIEKPKNIKNKRYIIDNVIPETMFGCIEKYITGMDINWNYQQGTVNEGDSDWRFSNVVYHSKSGFKSNKYAQFSPIFDFLHAQTLISVKLNCDIHTQIPEQRQFHTDNSFYGDFSFTAILYLNDCNGKTIFEDGAEIQSKRNRMIVFNSSERHAGVTQTDVPRRHLMNINYLANAMPVGEEF